MENIFSSVKMSKI